LTDLSPPKDIRFAVTARDKENRAVYNSTDEYTLVMHIDKVGDDYYVGNSKIPSKEISGYFWLYFYTGVEWIIIATELALDSNNDIKFKSKQFGQFKVVPEGKDPNPSGILKSKITVANSPMTPNGDAVNDIVNFHFVLTDKKPVDIKAQVLTKQGSVLTDIADSNIKRLGRAVSIAWDGRDKNNELYKPGVYFIRIKAEDNAYNGIFYIYYNQ
jgi:hypothetical protein